MQRLWPILLAGASGILLALAFPKVDWNILAWVAFIPPLQIIQGQTLRRAFVLGWISGMGFYLCTLYWVVDTIGLYSNIPHIIAVGPLLLMCAILSVYTGVFAACPYGVISMVEVKPQHSWWQLPNWGKQLAAGHSLWEVLSGVAQTATQTSTSASSTDESHR